MNAYQLNNIRRFPGDSFPAQIECSQTSQVTVKDDAANPGSGRPSVGDLTNCTIGKITININPAVTVPQSVEEEIVKSLEFLTAC